MLYGPHVHISNRKRNVMKLKTHGASDTEKVLRGVIDNIVMPACLIDMSNHHIIYNNAIYRQFFKIRDSMEKRCHVLIHGNAMPCSGCPLVAYDPDGPRSWDMAKTHHAKSNSWITSRCLVINIPDRAPICLSFFEVQQETVTAKNTSCTNFDALTGLVNARGYKQDGPDMYAKAITKGIPLAVIAMKIDGLHQINALYGYSTGDETLRKLSQAISVALPPDSLFVRLRRNDFCALVPVPGDNRAVELLLKEICHLPTVLSVKRRPMYLCRIYAGASLLKDKESFHDLNFLAWDACSRAILRTDHPFEVVEDKVASERIILKRLKRELPAAIAERQMELFYQPKYDVRTQTIVGAEALSRWNHNLHGRISPGLFIPMAERSGQISIIDTWVIQETCRTIQELKKLYSRPVALSVNVSPRTFFDTSLERVLLKACERYDISPNSLELELTEGTALSNLTMTRGVMERLREQGFRMAMDDFGVGYSSLSNLSLLPFDTIKLDRSFIANPDPRTRRVFPSIVSLVRSHEMNLLIEGVETIEQLDMVQDSGCRYIQGFYFSPPLPFNAFTEKLCATNARMC